MSGIYIKGMEIPKGCASCFLKYGSCASIRKRMDVSKGDRWCPENYRHPDCPIVSVPPHGRLIDADALLADVRAHSESYFADDFAHEWVDVAPTVIPADKDGEA